MLQAANVEAAVSKLRADGHTASGVVCHVGKREDRDNLIQETVAQYGGLDILVSNAAVNPYFGSSSRVQIFNININHLCLQAPCWSAQRRPGTRYLRLM